MSAVARAPRWSATTSLRVVSPLWLWLSLPITLLALAASLAGIMIHSVYAKETANWAGQAVGQDIANAFLYPALLALALLAARGSLRAYLAWAGLLAYSVYTYAVYAFATHFGPLFLLHIAILGLSVYALIGSLTSIDAARVKAAFGETAPVRQTAWVLNALVLVFCALWLSSDIPATLRNVPSNELREAGVLTNPVHVLDLAIFIPALALTAVFLLRGRPLGFVLAPVLLVAAIGIDIAVVSLSIVLTHRGQSSLTGGIFMGLLALVESFVLFRFLCNADDDLSRTLIRHDRAEGAGQ
jgi:hypothetical protein